MMPEQRGQRLTEGTLKDMQKSEVSFLKITLRQNPIFGPRNDFKRTDSDHLNFHAKEWVF